MNNLNRLAQVLLLILIGGFIFGFFQVPSKISYGIGAFIMYIMCSIVLNKYQSELKEIKKEV